MGNNTYAIPIKKLCDEKNDPTIESFTAGLGIDLSEMIDCKYPTIQDLKLSIRNSGLIITVDKIKIK